MELEKNPFSIYDFLGYEFPGAFCLLSLNFIVNNNNHLQSINDIYRDINFDIYHLQFIDNAWIILLIFVLLAYFVGHIVSYISSMTIERILLWFYGYPSEFLLGKGSCHLLDYYKLSTWKYSSISKTRDCHFLFLDRLHKLYYILKLCPASLLRLIYIFFMLPISLCSLLIYLLGFNSFLVKELDSFLKKSIEIKEQRLSMFLHLPDPTIYEGVDYHRLIDHFCYEKMKGHREKFNNYVALYDFMRSMSLIFNVITLYIIINMLFIQHVSILTCDSLFLIVFLISVTYILFLGFFKFYRRYTLEGYMCLITESN